jgi:pimeloyl-ACP methyl ester carboxylesterase
MTIPALLIPGLGCTSEIWAGQVAGLWSRGPVAIANHLQGDSIAAIATSILAAAPPRFALAGISMGGYLAFEIWRRAPERVRGLALVDTQARPDSPEATGRRRDAVALAQSGKFRQVLLNAFPLTVHPDHVNSAALSDLNLRMSLANGVNAYANHQQAIITRPDSRPDLATITVPTTIIVGEGDRLTPPELSREMAALIPGATLEMIAQAGHLALAEQPEATTAALLRWLDRLQ